ncbi:erythrocyte membrane protein 1, PfEMP1, putative [Plasmodium reichenowi]|uniref:Erythrocyte membrane protein 1, PfEMP1, putative n=1 Tax=Plasmodium reichenowi TaxID=5854 RepID=A0A2P9D4Y0_PLARE|nr:erythrocyte membrane protein 1, PfEMP1, putative [Plasmodium reichenowi]
MAAQSGSSSAKEVLDEIGKEIQEEAHDAAENFRKELQGELSKVEFSHRESVITHNPCELKYTHDTNVTTSVIHPCDNRSPVRFSDTKGPQCYRSTIKGNDNSNNAGACAPFRRLHLCDKNLEQIKPEQIKSTHNLFVDVLLAAKYEGESIIKNYRQLDNNTNIGVCTVLARSFADIGDIIRGKDHFLGHNQRKKNLEKSLETMFENIKKNNNSKLVNLSTEKVREYWWALNRKDVWRAITCGAGASDDYFKKSSNGVYSFTGGQCGRDKENVPTNLDYVPQFLRWFEEWAEDFCHKKKKKVPNVRKNCREKDKSDEYRYCSRNGHDCEQTINRIGKLVIDKGCINCLYACDRYEKWIDNKKKEFLKQKKKCENEIYGNKAQNSLSGNINEYEKKFYEKLKKKYNDVKSFLNLLNKEKECKSIIDTEGGKIDFSENLDYNNDNNNNNENEGTFYRSKYCQVCPNCGVENKGNGKFEDRNESHSECKDKNLYTDTKGVDPTNIKILRSGEGHEEIKKKLTEFCETTNPNNISSLYEEWKCYYEHKDNEACILDNRNKKKSDKDPEEFQKSFNDFFTLWVNHMIKDSIEWRNEIIKCINNAISYKCKRGCHGKCYCYKRWIEEKKKEWMAIKQHFNKQTDILDDFKFITLENVLENDFFEGIKEAYGNDKEIDRIKNVIQSNPPDKTVRFLESEDIVQILLKHELEEAEDCLDIHDEEETEDNDDECDDDHEEVYVNNRCISGTHRAMLNKVAADMHLAAKIQLLSRGSKSSLKGKAHEGIYNEGGKSSDLKKVCDIKLKHSNRNTGESTGPCDGKGDGFKIGEEWSHGTQISTAEDVYLPKRREHFCTSNLERLKTSNPGLSDSRHASHSLLGDVLLAAKYQAEQIITKYKLNKGKEKLEDREDKKTVCRSMKYSFADIGDIIKGTDLWDKNEGEERTQDKLKEIFGNIHKSLKDKPKSNDKYPKDANTNPPYKQLRSDWWEANRHQVWKAMKCAIKNGSFPCKSDNTPYDDYIPQRLRWMTEWAEWYCKAQSQAYDTLMDKCAACKIKDQKCWKGDGKICADCKTACGEYTTKIQKWANQWNKMKIKYITSYWQAKTTLAGTVLGGADYQQLQEFFKQLQKEIKSSAPKRPKRSTDDTNTDPILTSPYSTAAGYIHQEAHIGDCEEQNEFCYNKNGVTSPGGKANEKYAFKNTPHDYDDECGCQNKSPPPKKPTSAGRSDNQDENVPRPRAPSGDEEAKGDTVPSLPKEDTQLPDACSIVKTLFDNPDQFKDKACKQKYGSKSPVGWKCISDTTGASGNPTSSGSICVPPRRRKLYIHKTDDVTTTNESLREWFVKSAAVETFFLWDRYKKLKKPPKKQQDIIQGSLLQLEEEDDEEDGEENPEDKLKDGDIPEEFLRQMFYTLGDYRDILMGNNKDILEAAASSDEEQNKMQKIKNAIEQILPKNSDSKPHSVPPSQPQTPGQLRENWWDENAKYIWEGMICALRYKENGSDKPLKQIDGAENLLEKIGKDGKEGDYHYKKVQLVDDDSGRKPLDTDPLLTDFVKRPFFFRWLEEWGDEFCRKKKKKIDKIKRECRSDKTGRTYCSGDGHDCTENGELKHNNISADLVCRDCYEQCRKYKKWIDMKFEEFDKQKGIYGEEHGKIKANCNGDNDKKFCTEIKKDSSTAARFLKELKHCKPGEGDGSDPYNKLDFEKPLETFGPLEYCKTCPPNIVTCNRSKLGRGGGTNGCNVNRNTWKDVFNGISGNGEKSTIDVQIIDRTWPFIETYSQESKDLFKPSRLFKGLRKQQWECRYNKEKKMDVCHLNQFNKEVDLNDYTTFKVFVLYWLEDFIDGYYILEKRKLIEKCTKNVEKLCKQDSKNACACVKAWVDQKKTEWGEIKEYFQKQTRDNAYDIVYTVQSLLGNLIPRMDLVNDKRKINELSNFENLVGSNCIHRSENNKNNDVIDCILSDLQQKIKTCPPQTVDKPNQTCDESPTHVGDDDDDSLEEENTVTQPNICPASPPPPAEESGAPISTPTESNPEQTPVLKPEEEVLPGQEKSPKEDKDPKPLAPTPPEREFTSSDWRKVMSASAFPWTVGVAFVALTYWFLKKKTKSSVDLLRVMQISQNDYDIPTKLSRNRYIPYKSAQYRGKRYIYLEGDSGTDSGYTDHYSDITSSSESEYEEFDINDIYVPGSTKYKTLIEVVLEPSKRDTFNTPSGDTPNNKLTDNEWNTLKDEFISNMLQNEQNTEPNILRDNVDNNTHPTPSHDTLDQKPFIMSIHDRDLYTGEVYNYDMTTNSGNNDLYSAIDPTSSNHGPYSSKNGSYSDNRDALSDNYHPYSGIDLINDTLSGNKNIDIYDEILKRKENELFGTKHKKRTTTNSVAKNTNSDPITNQLEMFHKWLDRHRDMCEKWDTNNKVEMLDKLKEEWENETHSGNKHSDNITSGNIPSNNIHSSDIHFSDIPSGKHVLNSDVSIHIHMDDPKPINQFINMDTILEDLDKYNEPYYDVQDDIYYDVNDHDASTVDSNNMDVPSNVKIEMSVKNTQMMEEKYPIADVWDI